MKKKILIFLTLILLTTVVYPVVAEEIVSTEETVTTAEPEVTPEATVDPEVTIEPEVSTDPEVTPTPEATTEPEATLQPEVTTEPEVMQEAAVLMIAIEPYVADITSAFVDPAFRQYVVETYGTGGVVMDTDLSSVTTLVASGLAIQDISGIEYFTSLQTVDLSVNNLGTVSLSDFPQTVVSLNISNSNVSTLDTVGGGNITTLTISQNPLASIDLSNLTSLITFTAGDMTPALTSIDFSVAPWIEFVSLYSSYIPILDLGMLTNLKGINISGSETGELILATTSTSKNFAPFLVNGSRVEQVTYQPGTATVWGSNDLRPWKEILIDEDGHPYIELHRNSYVANLSALNANGTQFVFSSVNNVRRVTWVASTDPQAFYDQYNLQIQFMNFRPFREFESPYRGFYELVPPVIIEPEHIPDPVYYTVNFLDCDGKLVGQDWPQEGMNATAPEGYVYSSQELMSITFSKDVSPTSCSVEGGYKVPPTGR